MVSTRNTDQLGWNVKIVQENGTATPEFLRQFNRQRSVNDGLAQVVGLLDVNVVAGDGLDGGGSLGDLADITLALEDSGVTPGSYTSADITVDEFGRVTAAADGSSGSGGISEFYPAGFAFVAPAVAGLTLTANAAVTSPALTDLANSRGVNLFNGTAGSAAFARATKANAAVGGVAFTALFHAREQPFRDGNWGSVFGIEDSSGKFTGYGVRNAQLWRADLTAANAFSVFSNLGLVADNDLSPYWIKIVLAAGTFTAYYSEDGETFYQIDSRSATAYISGTRTGIACAVDSDVGNSSHGVDVFHMDAV